MTPEEEAQAYLARIKSRQAPATGDPRDEAKAYLASLNKSDKPKDSALEDFAEGLVVSGMDTYYGMKDLLGVMDDEDRATYNDWKEDAGESGWGTAGKVVGEVGSYMLPGGIAKGGLKILSKAGKLANIANKGLKVLKDYNIAREGIGAGIMGGTKLPEWGETRTENMLKEGGMGAAGAAVLKGVAGLAKGIKKSKLAQEMLDEGYYLTPAQAAGKSTGSQVVKLGETVGSAAPILKKGTEALEKEGTRGWNMRAFNRANPEGMPKITAGGEEGFQQLAKNVSSEYDRAWSGARSMTDEALEGATKKLENALQVVAEQDAPILKRIIRDIDNKSYVGSREQLQSLDRSLGKMINRAKSDPHLTKILQEVRKSLRKSLPEENRKLLEKMDKLYPDFKVLEKAVEKASYGDGVFTPKDLNTSMKVGRPGKAPRGKAPMQQDMKEGKELFETTGLTPSIGFMARAATSVDSPNSIMRGIGNITLGNTSPQRFLADLLRRAEGLTPDVMGNPLVKGYTAYDNYKRREE